MGWQSITTIYYLSLQLIILSLTVQGSPLPNYSTYFEGIDPISSSSASSSSPSSPSSSISLSPSSDVFNQQQDTQMSPEAQPGNMIEFEDSYPFPVKKGGGGGTISKGPAASSNPTTTTSISSTPPLSLASMMFHRHSTPIHFLINHLFKPPESLEESYKRGRRYRDKSDKSFIRFGRVPAPAPTLTIWPRESRKRPEKNNDTYFLRFGR